MRHASWITRVPRDKEAPKPEIVPILESPLRWLSEEKVASSKCGFSGLVAAVLHLTFWCAGFLGVGTLISYALHGRW
jgi:hypothetical protein